MKLLAAATLIVQKSIAAAVTAAVATAVLMQAGRCSGPLSLPPLRNCCCCCCHAASVH
jgi:hypothetical protein